MTQAFSPHHISGASAHEPDDRNVSRRRDRNSDCRGDGCSPSIARQRSEQVEERAVENRGIAWVLGAFVFCPCHLPLTLWILASVFAGTAIGVLISEHVVIAGVLVTSVWVIASWRGMWLMRRAETQRACERNSA